jgi:hypothetical protein
MNERLEKMKKRISRFSMKILQNDSKELLGGTRKS